MESNNPENQQTKRLSEPAYHRSKYIKKLLQKARIKQSDLPELVKDGTTRFAWGYRINLSDDQDFNFAWAEDIARALAQKGHIISPEEIYNYPKSEHQTDWKELAHHWKKEVERLEEKIRILKEENTKLRNN